MCLFNNKQNIIRERIQKLNIIQCHAIPEIGKHPRTFHYGIIVKGVYIPKTYKEYEIQMRAINRLIKIIMMKSSKELLKSINEIHESVKDLTKSGSCGEYGGQVDYEDTKNLIDMILSSPIVGSLLNIFWQRTSDACPLECTEAENQEADFKEWVKTIDFDMLVEMHDR